MSQFRTVTTDAAIAVLLFAAGPTLAADMKVLDQKYSEATDSLKKSQRLSSVVLAHDQDVLEKTYTDLGPKFEQHGLTSDDSAKALVGAYYILRSSKSLAPDVGLTREHLYDLFNTVQPIVIDSAPRGAEVQLIPDGGGGPIKTRNTVLLKPGQQVKIHFTMVGFKDRDETITADQSTSVICRELQPLDSRTPQPRCPK
jgi:hypothetical protein